MYEGAGVRHSQRQMGLKGESLFLAGGQISLHSAAGCLWERSEITGPLTVTFLFPSLALSAYGEKGSPHGGFSVSPSHLWEEELWWSGY